MPRLLLLGLASIGLSAGLHCGHLQAASLNTIDGKQMALPIAGSEDPHIAAQQLTEALAQRFSDCAVDDPGTQALAAWYSHWFKGAAISGKYWNIGVEHFQKWRDLADDIDALKQDDAWKAAAQAAWAEHIIFFRRPYEKATILAPYQAIPANSTVASVSKTKIIEAIASSDSAFSKRSAWEQRFMIEALRLINPQLLLTASYVTTKQALNERDPHTAVPIGADKVHVQTYAMSGDYPLLIPNAEWCQQAANPTEINLRNQVLLDVSVLKELSPQKLDISYTGCRDISALAEMKTVTELSIAGLNLSSLALVAPLQLKALDCSDNPITSFQPLKNMKLTQLIAKNTAVRNLNGLERSPLQHIDMGNAALTSLSGLKAQKLTSASFYHTNIRDLSALSGAPLTTLDIDRTPVNDLSSLANMPLVTLRCDPKGRYNGLDVLPTLQSLTEIAYGPVADIPFAPVITQIDDNPVEAADPSQIEDIGIDLGLGD